MSSLDGLDATDLARLITRREVKEEEVLEFAIARSNAVNPAINAVVTPLFDRARAQTRSPVSTGPFRGVPFLLKDLGSPLAGAPFSMGSAALKSYVAPRSSELVRRFERAGLVIMGKTNTSELGILPTSEGRHFGAARNPWNLEHATGGSSGGSAAAVAAGIVPMAHASDTGGSIRIPASCCGIFGIKPSRGRVSLGPDLGDVMNGLVAEFVVSRSVRDSATLLDAVDGTFPGEPYVAPAKPGHYTEAAQRDPKNLRIAFSTESPLGSSVHADCKEAVAKTVSLLERLGHRVEEVRPDVDAFQLNQAFVTVWMAGTAQDLEVIGEMRGQAVCESDVEALTWAAAEMGKMVTATAFLNAMRSLQSIGRKLGAFLEEFDAFLTPTVAEPPLPLGSLKESPDFALMPLTKAAEWACFTPIANAAGVPAMSVPLHWNTAGLPIGSHFLGALGAEHTLFALAGQLERASPWSHRKPSL